MMDPIDKKIKATALWFIEKAHDETVVLTPVVCGEMKNTWYFTVSTSDSNGEWHVDSVYSQDKDDAVAVRTELMLALINMIDAFVIHDCDDELYAARLCATLWPGARIENVVKSIVEERGQ